MQIIPKQESKRLLGPGSLFVVSLLVFFLAVSAFFLFQHLQSQSRQSLQKVEAFLSSGTTAQEKELEQGVLSDQKKIRDFASLVSARKDSSAFFRFLEQYTHPRIAFTTMVLTTATNSAMLQGQALDFPSLGDQVALFSQRPEVAHLKLSDLRLGPKGGATFSMELIFSPKVFQQ